MKLKLLEKDQNWEKGSTKYWFEDSEGRKWCLEDRAGDFSLLYESNGTAINFLNPGTKEEKEVFEAAKSQYKNWVNA